jgi:Ala-tRNA(Pro) deacylase
MSVFDRARIPCPMNLTEALSAADATFQIVPHRRTESAMAEARAVGYPPELVAKTVVVTVRGARIRVVVPASKRLSMKKLAGLVGDGARLLDESELACAYPEFELGAVPPFGGPGERTIVDVGVARRPSVIVEAGAHDLSLKLPARELVAAAHADVADVADG